MSQPINPFLSKHFSQASESVLKIKINNLSPKTKTTFVNKLKTGIISYENKNKVCGNKR